MRIAIIASVMSIILFCISPMANADIVELPLDCNGVYDFNSPYWTTDFDFGITFTEISHVYIDWSGEITGGLAIYYSNPGDPFPQDVGITAYLSLPISAGTTVWGGETTYPDPEPFDYSSELEIWGGGSWAGLLNGQGTVWIYYDEISMLDGMYVQHGSVTLNRANLVVVGTVAPEFVVDAEVDIEPDTLNLQSKGKWLTCYIWLPEDYNVADIKPNTVRLEERSVAKWLWFEDDDEVAMAKFKRSDIQEMVEPGEVELTIAGRLVDGTYFEGTDTIKVIDKGGKK